MARQKPLNEINPIADESLLVTRDQARVLLGGICYSTILDLEKRGELKSRRLSPGPKAKAYFQKSDVIALATKGAEKQKPPRPAQ
jgi:hypothetical protein